MRRGRRGWIRRGCWIGRPRPVPHLTPLPHLLSSSWPHASVACSRTPAEWPSTTTGSPCRCECVPTPGWQSARPSAFASIPTAPSLASPQPSLGSIVANPAEPSPVVALTDQANDDGVCWPCVGSIIRRTRLNERTVQKALRRLAEYHHISATGHASGGHASQTPISRGALGTDQGFDGCRESAGVNVETQRGEPRSPKPS